MAKGTRRNKLQDAKRARKAGRMNSPGGNSRYAQRVKERGYPTQKMSEHGRHSTKEV